jgi:diguanylate cyclase (GGDEF)-like protein
MPPHGPVVVVTDRVDTYQAQLLAGVRTELTALGVPMLVYVIGVRSRVPASLIRLLSGGRIAGALLTVASNPATHQQLTDLLEACAPLPVVRFAVPGPGVTVGSDNREGMRLVARHLVEDCGARRIVMGRGPAHHPDSLEREASLREALTTLGVDLPDELVVDAGFTRGEGFAAVRDLLARGVRFDAVAAANDRSAFGAVDALLAAGLRIPEDVVVTGFDDEDVAALATPSLTTVNQYLEAQGALAARLVLELMSGRPATSTRVPVDLRHRETTGGPGPVHDQSDELRGRLVAVDTVQEISRAVLSASSVEDVIERICSHLPRLGVDRAFLVLRTDEPGEPRGFVALSYDGAQRDTTAEQTFDLSQLLPEHLAHHLNSGTLVLQPLVTGDTELGYLILDRVTGDHAVIGEALGMDLSRALDSIRTTSRLARHAEELETLVAERTQQLASEIGIRRRAEAELRRVNAELRTSLHLDGLTGISNRAAFDDALATQWAQHSRSGQPLSLLMIDVDHFKAYNDRYGHVRGDEALRAIAECMRASVKRLGDTIARVGGEEFTLLLPNTGADGAMVVATRLRRLVAKAGISHLDSPVGQRLTISIGVASTYADPLSEAQELVAAADAALYDVKDAGRDGIACTQGRPVVSPTAAQPPC